MLYAPPQGVEQRCYRQGRSEDGQLAVLAGYRGQETLESGHASDVHERQHHGERTVDEGTVYDHVYVVEAVTKDGVARRKEYGNEGEGGEEPSNRLISQIVGEDPHSAREG